ncbi:ABC-2 type transport system permease protein [Pseudoclavibacter chungangensis]|uniref:ABC transporter permease n=1 Tax=Pseudoclavibacter chungangensis TaxID=587635 RepID=UPI0015CE8A5B|nr:ABC transporter permease [Pseudoclavibacter chungangensis]NYJ67666.1 ABC-2 type transport system permease protein [Pseudoclavibacter chungangensis]
MRIEQGGPDITTTELDEPRARGSWLSRRPTLNLVANLTLREVRAQYKRTALGRLWSLLNPIATIAIYGVIFGVLFQTQVHVGTNSGIHLFALWLAAGLIPWTFISGGITSAMGSLTTNAGLLTKVWFPRHVLVTSTVLSLATTFAIELGVLSIVMMIASVLVQGVAGLMLLAYLPVLLLVVAITVGFVIGIGLMLSVAVVYFRDIQHIWGIVTQAWFYASGIVFPISVVGTAEEHLRASGFDVPLIAVFKLNPAYHYLEAFRSIIYDFAMPGPQTWLIIIGWAAVMILLGILVFRRFSGRIVEEL